MNNKQTLPTPRYQPGDRVAERPKNSSLVAVREESLEIIKKYRSQRYGTVVGTVVKEIKSLKKTARSLYVDVIWDGQRTPSRHAQMRLCFESELPTLQDSFTSV